MKDEFIKMKKCGVTNPQVSSLNFSLGNEEFGVYVKKANGVKSLSSEEELEIAKRAKAGDKDAKDKLIQANLKLVLAIAKKTIHMSKLPMVDLIQEGNLGLIVAIEKFNPDLGYRFSTYASWWIKQAMFKAISEQSYCMKIPVYVQETLSKFSKVKSQMEKTNNYAVTNQKVAERMDISPEKINTYLAAYTSTISIEGNIDGKNGSEMNVADMLEDKNTSVESNIEYENLKRDINNIILTLKEREQTVIKMRFGLENFTKTTLEEIGKMLGVTKECIRQTEVRALNKLRNNALLSCYAD